MENWTLTWTKLNKLDEGNINSMPDNLPGVYRLSYKGKDGSYYVFYVGQARDIKERLSEHLSEAEDNVCIKIYLSKEECFFKYAKISREDLRNTAERQMYRHYEPVCNIKEPEEGGENFQFNLN